MHTRQLAHARAAAVGADDEARAQAPPVLQDQLRQLSARAACRKSKSCMSHLYCIPHQLPQWLWLVLSVQCPSNYGGPSRMEAHLALVCSSAGSEPPARPACQHMPTQAPSQHWTEDSSCRAAQSRAAS
jgi:hypothetical protein